MELHFVDIKINMSFLATVNKTLYVVLGLSFQFEHVEQLRFKTGVTSFVIRIDDESRTDDIRRIVAVI